MLSRVSGASRPENLLPEFGLVGEGSQRAYKLSDVQAQAILEMRLQRLTGLEQDKIVGEYREVMDKIADLLDILAKPERITQIIGDELVAIKAQYGDKRRSEIITHTQDMSMEDLIAPEDVVVTLSHGGYMKAQPLDEYRAQKRGGRGKQAASTKEDDFVDNLFIANTHDYILCFSSRGQVYWIKVYDVPQGSRTSRGKPIVNLLPLEEGEKINAILPVKEFAEDQFIFMATANGTVKKTPLSDFRQPAQGRHHRRQSGRGRLPDRRGADRRQARRDAVLRRRQGGAFRRGRCASDGSCNARRARHEAGRGRQGDRAAGGRRRKQTVLTATENGYGKRTPIAEYTRHGRGTQGMIAIQTSERNGKVVAATLVTPKTRSC